MPRPFGMCTSPARRISCGCALVMSLPVERDRARRRGHEPRHGAGERALARAVGAEHARAPTPAGHVDARRPNSACTERVLDVEPLHREQVPLAGPPRGVVVRSVACVRAAFDGLVVAEVRGPHRGVVADLVGASRTRCGHRSRARRPCGQPEHHRDVVLDEQQRDPLFVDDGAQRGRELRVSWRRDPTTARRAARRTGPVASARATSTRRRDAERERPTRRCRRRCVSPSRSRRCVDPARARRADGRCSAPAVDEVAPQPAALVAHPVAEHEVLAHRQPQEQLGLLEGAGQAQPGPLRRRARGDRRRRRGRRRRRWGRSSPDSTPKSVVFPAPFGPTRPTIVAGGTARLTSLSATRPPKRTVTLLASSTGTVAATPPVA